MKESLLLYLFLLTSMVATAMDADGIWIRRTEKLGSTASSSQMSKLTIPPKFQRSSCLAGQIILEFDDPVPLEFRSSLQAAADAWGARLKNKYPMVILVCYKSLGSDVAVQTDCIYYPNGGYAYPGMLYCQLFDWEPELDFLPGIITLNSAVNWDCTNAPKTEVVAAKNVYSTMLRAIATMAGFGSSVYSLTDDDLPQFGNGINITPFDNIVFSSVGERLADKNDAVALAEFVQPPSGVNIFALYDDLQYKLYAPTTFISDMSLRYLDNPDALMHYDFGLGDTRLQIDRVTSDLLNAIGWSVVPDQEVSIKCDDIDSTGIGSAYAPHTFRIDGIADEQMSGIRWTFNLFDESQSPVIYSTGSQSSFTIPAIHSSSNYYINPDGDIVGEVIFDGIIDGKEKHMAFKTFLELAPEILSVSEMQFDYNANSFDVSFSVQYAGSDRINVYEEEDYNFGTRMFSFAEPYIAYVKVPYITYGYYAWIDIEVSNKYGKATHTIELSPIPRPTTLDIRDLSIEKNERFEIFNIQGCLIRRCDSLKDASLSKGAYIVRRMSGDRLINTEKLLVK